MIIGSLCDGLIIRHALRCALRLNVWTIYINTYIILCMKQLRFVGSSLDDLRSFPVEARRQAGFELYAIQRDLEPLDWKPMKTVGSGVREIRIRVLGEWRVLYVAKFADAVYVLHAFQKKTQKTRRNDLEIAQRRYKQIGE